MFGRVLRFFCGHFQSLKARLRNCWSRKKQIEKVAICFCKRGHLVTLKVSILQPCYIRRGKRKGGDFMFEKGVLFHSFVLFFKYLSENAKKFRYERCSIKVRANMKWACRIIQSYSFFGFEIKARWQECHRAFLYFHIKMKFQKIFADFCNFFGSMVENAQKIGITIMKAICGTMFCIALLRSIL